jgi:hypothetical protein
MPWPARVTPGEQRQDHQSRPFGDSVTLVTESPNGYLILVLLSAYFGRDGWAAAGRIIGVHGLRLPGFWGGGGERDLRLS